jgi:uncharacterized protein
MSEAEFKVSSVLSATISPSEDPAKVAAALSNIVGEPPERVTLRPRSARLSNDTRRPLARIRDQFRDRHIRSAARKQLLSNLEGGSTSVMLNRQAAAAGVVALCGSTGESPMGPIYLKIESDKIDGVIDWITSYSEG